MRSRYPAVVVLFTLGFAACARRPATSPPAESTPSSPIAVDGAVAELSGLSPSASAPAVATPLPSTEPVGSAGDGGVHDAAPVDRVGEVLALEANLTLVDTVVGTGREVHEGDRVTVHEVGTLQNGTVFESTRVRKRPLRFAAGGDKVVMGLAEGVVGMRVGGHRTLTVPPSLGYGRRGLGKKVPPNATLIYEVELLSLP